MFLFCFCYVGGGGGGGLLGVGSRTIFETDLYYFYYCLFSFVFSKYNINIISFKDIKFARDVDLLTNKL